MADGAAAESAADAASDAAFCKVPDNVDTPIETVHGGEYNMVNGPDQAEIRSDAKGAAHPLVGSSSQGKGDDDAEQSATGTVDAEILPDAEGAAHPHCGSSSQAKVDDVAMPPVPETEGDTDGVLVPEPIEEDQPKSASAYFIGTDPDAQSKGVTDTNPSNLSAYSTKTAKADDTFKHLRQASEPDDRFFGFVDQSDAASSTQGTYYPGRFVDDKTVAGTEAAELDPIAEDGSDVQRGPVIKAITKLMDLEPHERLIAWMKRMNMRDLQDWALRIAPDLQGAKRDLTVFCATPLSDKDKRGKTEDRITMLRAQSSVRWLMSHPMELDRFPTGFNRVVIEGNWKVYFGSGATALALDKGFWFGNMAESLPPFNEAPVSNVFNNRDKWIKEVGETVGIPYRHYFGLGEDPTRYDQFPPWTTTLADKPTIIRSLLQRMTRMYAMLTMNIRNTGRVAFVSLESVKVVICKLTSRNKYTNGQDFNVGDFNTVSEKFPRGVEVVLCAKPGAANDDFPAGRPMATRIMRISISGLPKPSCLGNDMILLPNSEKELIGWKPNIVADGAPWTDTNRKLYIVPVRAGMTLSTANRDHVLGLLRQGAGDAAVYDQGAFHGSTAFVMHLLYGPTAPGSFLQSGDAYSASLLQTVFRPGFNDRGEIIPFIHRSVPVADSKAKGKRQHTEQRPLTIAKMIDNGIGSLIDGFHLSPRCKGDIKLFKKEVEPVVDAAADAQPIPDAAPPVDASGPVGGGQPVSGTVPKGDKGQTAAYHFWEAVLEGTGIRAEMDRAIAEVNEPMKAVAHAIEQAVTTPEQQAAYEIISKMINAGDLVLPMRPRADACRLRDSSVEVAWEDVLPLDFKLSERSWLFTVGMCLVVWIELGTDKTITRDAAISRIRVQVKNAQSSKAAPWVPIDGQVWGIVVSRLEEAFLVSYDAKTRSITRLTVQETARRRAYALELGRFKDEFQQHYSIVLATGNVREISAATFIRDWLESNAPLSDNDMFDAMSRAIAGLAAARDIGGDLTSGNARYLANVAQCRLEIERDSEKICRGTCRLFTHPVHDQSGYGHTLWSEDLHMPPDAGRCRCPICASPDQASCAFRVIAPGASGSDGKYCQECIETWDSKCTAVRTTAGLPKTSLLRRAMWYTYTTDPVTLEHIYSQAPEWFLSHWYTWPFDRRVTEAEDVHGYHVVCPPKESAQREKEANDASDASKRQRAQAQEELERKRQQENDADQATREFLEDLFRKRDENIREEKRVRKEQDDATRTRKRAHDKASSSKPPDPTPGPQPKAKATAFGKRQRGARRGKAKDPMAGNQTPGTVPGPAAPANDASNMDVLADDVQVASVTHVLLEGAGPGWLGFMNDFRNYGDRIWEFHQLFQVDAYRPQTDRYPYLAGYASIPQAFRRLSGFKAAFSYAGLLHELSVGIQENDMYGELEPVEVAKDRMLTKFKNVLDFVTYRPPDGGIKGRLTLIPSRLHPHTRQSNPPTRAMETEITVRPSMEDADGFGTRDIYHQWMVNAPMMDTRGEPVNLAGLAAEQPFTYKQDAIRVLLEHKAFFGDEPSTFVESQRFSSTAANVLTWLQTPLLQKCLDQIAAHGPDTGSDRFERILGAETFAHCIEYVVPVCGRPEGSQQRAYGFYCAVCAATYGSATDVDFDTSFYIYDATHFMERRHWLAVAQKLTPADVTRSILWYKRGMLDQAKVHLMAVNDPNSLMSEEERERDRIRWRRIDTTFDYLPSEVLAHAGLFTFLSPDEPWHAQTFFQSKAFHVMTYFRELTDNWQVATENTEVAIKVLRKLILDLNATLGWGRIEWRRSLSAEQEWRMLHYCERTMGTHGQPVHWWISVSIASCIMASFNHQRVQGTEPEDIAINAFERFSPGWFVYVGDWRVPIILFQNRAEAGLPLYSDVRVLEECLAWASIAAPMKAFHGQAYSFEPCSIGEFYPSHHHVIDWFEMHGAYQGDISFIPIRPREMIYLRKPDARYDRDHPWETVPESNMPRTVLNPWIYFPTATPTVEIAD